MWLLIFNLWHKKKIIKIKIRGYKTIHTFTKRIEGKTNDNDNKNNRKVIIIIILVLIIIITIVIIIKQKVNRL